MAIGAAIGTAVSWIGANAAAIGAVTAVGTAAYSASQAKKNKQAAPSSSTIMGPQAPVEAKEDEEVIVGSDRSKGRKGRQTGRTQLMAPQSPPTAGSSGVRV